MLLQEKMRFFVKKFFKFWYLKIKYYFCIRIADVA